MSIESDSISIFKWCDGTIRRVDSKLLDEITPCVSVNERCVHDRNIEDEFLDFYSARPGTTSVR